MIKYTLLGVIFVFASVLIAQPDSAYRSYDEVVEWIHTTEAAYPTIFYAESIGISTRDSLPLWAYKISDNADEDEDELAVLFAGSIHAEELVGTEVCIFAAESLLAGYGIEPAITRYVDSLAIWFIPVVNPEGYQVVIDGLDMTYRKNKRDNNGNGIFDYTPEPGGDFDGVDLNRNFPYDWDGVDSEPDTSSPYYRGPAAASEQEIQAVMRLAERERFVSAIFYHSSASGAYNEFVIYPWHWGECPDYSAIGGAAVQIAFSLHSLDGYAYHQRFNEMQNGNSMDCLYAYYGTFSYIVEIDTCTQPEGWRLPSVVRNQFSGINYLLDRSLGTGIWVHSYDADADTPMVARVEVAEARNDALLLPRSTTLPFGSHYRLLAPGDYTILASADSFSAETLSVTVPSEGHIAVDIEMHHLSVTEAAGLPTTPAISVSPNPFNSSVKITVGQTFLSVQNGQTGMSDLPVTIKVYDLRGHIVGANDIRPMDKGCIRSAPTSRTFIWTPDKSTTSGIYLVRARTQDGQTITKRIVYLK